MSSVDTVFKGIARNMRIDVSAHGEVSVSVVTRATRVVVYAPQRLRIAFTNASHVAWRGDELGEHRRCADEAVRRGYTVFVWKDGGCLYEPPQGVLGHMEGLVARVVALYATSSAAGLVSRHRSLCGSLEKPTLEN